MLESLKGPEDLKGLTHEQLAELAQEIRTFLIEKVSKTGGHLGPNLGVVELTIAMHRVFDSPKDVLLFDTGHQSYVHKILTGRIEGFDQLRQRGGISGYPNRAESEHDVIENSHASSALSWSDGIARGFKVQGIKDRMVVALVGDGALTGGMSWEALNNIATSDDLPLVIIVNDNERSYSPTIGGVATYLSTLRTTRGYEKFLEWGKGILERTPVVGQPIYETLHGVKRGIRDIVIPRGMFEDLGLKYFGPVDGHNIEAVENALVHAKNYGSPVLVHVITEKGRGHAPAVNDQAEKFHGLDQFQKAYPERTFDVGIAEQHAATSAAGMAYAGLHPVVAIYSTFLNRAFDQLLLDVALHDAGVTFVLDRSGITGDDGPSHNGIWDLALTGIVPHLYVAAPRDGARLKEVLREAIAINDKPTLIRFPKGAVPADIPAFERRDGIDVLYRGESADILLVSVGALAQVAVDAASQAYREGVGVTVIDLRWVKPLTQALVTMAQRYKSVVVIEDGIRHGGIASSISDLFREAGLSTPIHSIGVPLEFIEHSKRDEILNDLGITVQTITRSLVTWSLSLKDQMGELDSKIEEASKTHQE